MTSQPHPSGLLAHFGVLSPCIVCRPGWWMFALRTLSCEIQAPTESLCPPTGDGGWGMGDGREGVSVRCLLQAEGAAETAADVPLQRRGGARRDRAVQRRAGRRADPGGDAGIGAAAVGRGAGARRAQLLVAVEREGRAEGCERAEQRQRQQWGGPRHLDQRR